ncbi:MAG: mismatch repair protein MutS [Clostridia bacterium]|nr:mismatch repair protein MutS [Clostridia bacterium]
MPKGKSLTPMMAQYREIKSKHPDSILFFRLGDFYEMFYEDAEVASRELDLVLTSRGGKDAAPMCGVPYHAADSYLARLVNKGYKVAICEQVEDPRSAKGLVKREVIRVVTPGTITDEKVLPTKGNNYLAAIAKLDNNWGLAWADASTGEFLFTSCHDIEALLDELVRIMPSEFLLPEELVNDKSFCRRLKMYSKGVITNWTVIESTETAFKVLHDHFRREDIEKIDFTPSTSIAVAMVLSFLLETQHNALAHLEVPVAYSKANCMALDQATRRNLELVVTSKDKKREGSLLWVLDKTTTAMGGRTLRSWLDRPLTDLNVIKARQQAVTEFVENFVLCQELRDILHNVHDLERIAGRVAYGTAGGRELQALRSSLMVLPKALELMIDVKADFLLKIINQIDPLDDIVDLLTRALVDNPPVNINEGGVIRPGYNDEVDRLRKIALHGREWIASLETEERERTGIKSLKIGYNRVFGYYIEVTRPNLSLVPDDYERKQTLSNSERFTTRRLKELEQQILGAEERLIDLEYEIFQTLCQEVISRLPRIRRTARAIGILDVVLSLAIVAVNNNYVCPEVDSGMVIQIEQGRHAVVEQVTSGEFVPNDTYIDEEQKVHIITGPNMAGKSTYIRQVALIVLMAQIGSFVPAQKARIGLVDRIFTRVGAADDLFSGQSTFMVEMHEVAYILNNATERSLVILDEVGRGTSTSDGLSIARAVTEYLHNVLKSRTLFATHYHELIAMADELKGVKNYCVAVKEKGEDIIFLRTIVPGSTDKSYGIHVARLAGVPETVLNKAKLYLEGYTTEQKCSVVEENNLTSKLTNIQSKVLDEIKNFDLMNSTPLQIMKKVYYWQKKLKEE